MAGLGSFPLGASSAVEWLEEFSLTRTKSCWASDADEEALEMTLFIVVEAERVAVTFKLRIFN